MGDSILASTGDWSSGFDRTLIPAISEIVSGRVRLELPASSMTTFAVGGALDAVVTVESVEELQAALSLLHKEGQRIFVFGFGSNLLVGDQGLRGWVIRLGAQFREVASIGSNMYRLGGACSLMSISRKLSEDGLAGLEFAAGIPASVGGAAFMNAGAHGAEIGSRVECVSTVMPDGSLREWKRDELSWRYRCSGLPDRCVVTSVQVALIPGDRQKIAKTCADNLAHRRATQPLALPSAGSVFKNPSPDRPAGRVLEETGLKGASVGGARVSELHANWIVNPEKTATAADLKALMTFCVSKVQEQTGIVLHPEVKVWDTIEA